MARCGNRFIILVGCCSFGTGWQSAWVAPQRGNLLSDASMCK